MITTFLFDLDDTIIDGQIYAEMYQPVLTMIQEKTGIAADKKAQEVGLQKNTFGRWDTGDLCRKLGLLEEYYRILEEHVRVREYLKKEIFPLLEKISGKKGIVSNSMRRTIMMYIEKYGIKEHFDFVFSYDEAESSKKEEEYWQKLIATYDLVPKQCLVIGDNPVDDIAMPSTFGFHTLLINESKDFEKILDYC
jgi:HAD superfamily hydrolase (TIGR01549 family)